MVRSVWAIRSWVCAALFMVSLAVSGVTQSQQSENVESVIQYLLKHVADSGLIFIRNSKSFDGADAADHMNTKYEYYRDKIKTPEDFIQRCASKSLLSGKYYRVVLDSGEEMRTDDWLLGALVVYRRDAEPGYGLQKE